MTPLELCRTKGDQAVELLRTLAHPGRLLILAALLEGEQSVGELERNLGLKQPGLSQQLAELRDSGLVATRREAKSVIYRVADGRAQLLLNAVSAAVSGELPELPVATPTRIPSRGGAAAFARVG